MKRMDEEKLYEITEEAIDKMGKKLHESFVKEEKAINGFHMVEYLTKHFIGYALHVFADNHEEREAVLTTIAEAVAHAVANALDDITDAEAKQIKHQPPCYYSVGRATERWPFLLPIATFHPPVVRSSFRQKRQASINAVVMVYITTMLACLWATDGKNQLAFVWDFSYNRGS